MNLIRQIKLVNMRMLTVTGIINAIGITLFLYPVGLYDSGNSGTRGSALGRPHRLGRKWRLTKF
jgi:uncharacterized membrane-anchored protein YitT (DUF2179 family)